LRERERERERERNGAPKSNVLTSRPPLGNPKSVQCLSRNNIFFPIFIPCEMFPRIPKMPSGTSVVHVPRVEDRCFTALYFDIHVSSVCMLGSKPCLMYSQFREHRPAVMMWTVLAPEPTVSSVRCTLKKTPWSESASELYRPSDRRLWAK
jgi:hypothetical protein